MEGVNCKNPRIGSHKCFKECPQQFIPTYSLLRSDACRVEGEQEGGGFPCYRTSRPPSWTDRVIHSGGECEVYDAVREEYGDHLPVFAEYMLRV